MRHAEVEPRRYTAEEYFALEMKSEARHDFYEGQLIERPSDMTTHNTIVRNCLMAFRWALQHRKNQVYTLGILPVLRENEYYTYPKPIGVWRGRWNQRTRPDSAASAAVGCIESKN